MLDICIVSFMLELGIARSSRGGCGQSRRREHMVGVNMVLAESVQFKRGLYKSCGIECFEGIMLEPCLLQPCFLDAGNPTSLSLVLVVASIALMFDFCIIFVN